MHPASIHIARLLQYLTVCQGDLAKQKEKHRKDSTVQGKDVSIHSALQGDVAEKIRRHREDSTVQGKDFCIY